LAVCQCFGLKTTGTVSPDLASKPVAWVSWFESQNRQLWFGDLGLKITVMITCFEPQNQTGYGLSIAPQNQHEVDSV
jgi:hypothetical protein